MATAQVDLTSIKCTGKAECVGGKHPDPPLDRWPLLAWMPAHEKHGAKVFTEDGAVSVEAIAMDACTTPNIEALAAKHSTTADHASQAVDYALTAGFLS